MIDLIRDELSATSPDDALYQEITNDPANRYRKAFEYLQATRGHEAVSRVVRTAVWKAIDIAKWPSHIPPSSAANADSNICESIERCVDAWVLPSAVDILGRLLVNHQDRLGRAILTTNFDPLIGISISKHGGHHYGTVLHGDGSLDQTRGQGTHIVHLHGYWHGFDTLHTPQQLIQPRPRLQRSLERLVERSTLVVIGYSGWDDVVTSTLGELFVDSAANPEVLWAFHEADEEILSSSNAQLLSRLDPGTSRGRVFLYRGVDCREVLIELEARINEERLGGDFSTETHDSRSRISTNAESERPMTSGPTTLRDRFEPDSPLFVTPWVGRGQELDLLEASTMRVAFITGIGGQGKSALAGQLLRRQAMRGRRPFRYLGLARLS